MAARIGPNRIAEQLSNQDALVALPRLGDFKDDLERLFAMWSGRRPEFKFTRALAPNGMAAGIGEPMAASASSHVVRLWALDQIRALCKERKIAQAVQLAAQYQLVTAVSGVVVLETAQQFKDAGLAPADPATVAAVPEPSIWVLLLIGVGMLLLLRRAKPRLSLLQTFARR